jgi:hypothetical protein
LPPRGSAYCVRTWIRLEWPGSLPLWSETIVLPTSRARSPVGRALFTRGRQSGLGSSGSAAVLAAPGWWTQPAGLRRLAPCQAGAVTREHPQSQRRRMPSGEPAPRRCLSGRARSTEATMSDELPFKVVRSNGTDEVLACAVNLPMALGAYHVAARLYPRRPGRVAPGRAHHRAQ